MFHAGSNVPCIDSMYTPCALFCGLVCSSTFVSGGASGVALMSKFPINATYDERDRFLLDDFKRFRVSCACGIR